MDFHYKIANRAHSIHVRLDDTHACEPLQRAREHAYRVMRHERIPAFVEPRLIDELRRAYETDELRARDEQIRAVFAAKRTLDDVVTRKWTDLLQVRDETGSVSSTGSAGMTQQLMFAMAYHKLMHSIALEQILLAEQSYAENIHEVRAQRTPTDAHAGTAWHASDIDALKQVQRRQFREFILELHHNLKKKTLSPAPFSCNTLGFADDASAFVDNTPSVLEESFTIHLGSQQKHMYNIRVMAENELALCTNERYQSPSGVFWQNNPCRLQTAMALYSNDLCGIVLLAHLDRLTATINDLINICEQSTELHFLDIRQQLDQIAAATPNATPTTPTSPKTDAWASTLRAHLKPGDFFVTKHSNLSQTHVVFHLVVDDRTMNANMNSRDDAILGLRNVLKVACSSNVTTMTLPLLLSHELREEMTVQWCTRRAELVYKCTKGFMIEMASWGGADLKNVQFLVPKGIDLELFTSLTGMLPSIFKLSNPLIFTPNK